MDAQLCNGDRHSEHSPEYAHNPHGTVGQGQCYVVSEQYAPETESHVDGDEPNAKRVVGNEPHIPRIGQQTHWSAGRPSLAGVPALGNGCALTSGRNSSPVDTLRVRKPYFGLQVALQMRLSRNQGLSITFQAADH